MLALKGLFFECSKFAWCSASVAPSWSSLPSSFLCFPMVSYGSLWFCSGSLRSLRFSLWFLMVPYGFGSSSLWFIIVPLWFPMVPYGFHSGSLWILKVEARIRYGTLWCSLWFPMGFRFCSLWFSLWFPMGFRSGSPYFSLWFLWVSALGP